MTLVKKDSNGKIVEITSKAVTEEILDSKRELRGAEAKDFYSLDNKPGTSKTKTRADTATTSEVSDTKVAKPADSVKQPVQDPTPIPTPILTPITATAPQAAAQPIIAPQPAINLPIAINQTVPPQPAAQPPQRQDEEMTDGGVSIPLFHGNVGDDAKLWLNSLTDFIDFKTIAVDKRLSLFKLRLTGPAQAWMTALPNDQKDTFDHLSAAFILRFSPKELEKFRYAKELFNEKQSATQTVDQFITEIRKKSIIAGVDEATLAYIIINALAPNISSYVLEHDHQTIEQILQHARVAELTRGTPPTSVESGVAAQMLTLTEQVSKLNERIANLSIAAVNESPIKRQVSFEDVRARPQSPRERDRSGERDKYPYQRTNYSNNNDRPSSRPQNNAAYDGANYGRPNFRNYQRPDQQVRNDRPNYQPNPAWQGQGQQNQAGVNDLCGTCGYRKHDNPLSCPLLSKRCFSCNKLGHGARVCRARDPSRF